MYNFYIITKLTRTILALSENGVFPQMALAKKENNDQPLPANSWHTLFSDPDHYEIAMGHVGW